MTKAIPPIRKYMTTSPHTVGVDQTLHHAHLMMREHQIRHLPVLEGGTLTGMLTQRDLAVIEALKDVDPKKVKVEDAMSNEVFSVDPESPLDEVAHEMAERKFGSAVVVQNHKVVGIFTTVDLALALAELLRGRLKS
jgi:acetoin utilization protein AcuB